MNLRQYQLDLINSARLSFSKGIKSLIIQLPTGGGKTLLTAAMIKSAMQKGKSALFIVHRRELVKQTILAFDSLEIPHGVISAGFNSDPSKLIQIASIQTLSRRKLNIKPDLVVFDESHHLAASNWAAQFNSFDCYKIGLTATPCRLDGRGLSDFAQVMINGPSMRWLIENKYLSDYKLFMPPSDINLSGVHTRMGDYATNELSSIIDKPKISGHAVQEYLKRAQGKRAIIFCVNVAHSINVAEQFKLAGIPAAHLDGTISQAERDETIDKFKRGEILALSNADLFGEGLDIPAVECAILLRPTKSLSLYLQQVGRALRMSENKTHAVIIDHVRNCEYHGLPCEEKEWTLQGIKKRDNKSELKIKTCPVCFAALKQTVSVCQYCHYKFKPDPKPPANLNFNDQELVEVDKTAMRRSNKIDQAMAKTKDQLVELAIKRGYKKPHAWAHFVFQSRQRKIK